MVQWLLERVVEQWKSGYDIYISKQNQINKEAGMDVEDGGMDVPDATDGITRYPQDSTGSFIAPEDLDGEGENDGVNNKGDN